MTPIEERQTSLSEQKTDLVRTRILDALGELLHEQPWEKVSMSALAGQAGVSRQTIYNEFDGRDGIASAYVLREAGRFLEDVEDAVNQHADDMQAALRCAVAVFLEAASEHPVLRRLATGDTSDALLSLILSSDDAPIVAVATERLSAVLGQTWPAVERGRIEVLSDAAVRLAISHATQPSTMTRSDDHVDAIVAVLAPYVREFGEPEVQRSR